jgi:hypothetical protein
MFNFFGDSFSSVKSSNYHKLSEDIYSSPNKQENQMNTFTFSVGPSFSFDNGAAITFKDSSGVGTTVEMGFESVEILISLLQTMMATHKI